MRLHRRTPKSQTQGNLTEKMSCSGILQAECDNDNEMIVSLGSPSQSDDDVLSLRIDYELL